MEFNKEKIWDEYWCFKPKDKPSLQIFETLDYECWHKDKKHNIDIRLESYEEEASKPLQKQHDTLLFIIENQQEIIESIWKYYNQLILPIYDEAMGIEDEWLAKDISELSKIFGIKAIEIPPVIHDSFYYLIEFDFNYDCGHGLYILFKNSTPIDFFDIGTKDHDSIDIYENGLYNDDNSPINISITKFNGERLLKGDYDYNEEINFKLKKGGYRAFYLVNSSSRVRNFIVEDDLNNFTLSYILKNCSK